MAFFGDIVKGGMEGLLTGVGTFAKDIRAAITGTTILDATAQAELLQKTAALEAAAVQAKMDYERILAEGQLAINKVEAASSSLFVSGWRPAVGWVCVTGLFYTFLLKPLLPWTVAALASIVGRESALPLLPEVPMGDLVILLSGMLGFGFMRSYDKKNGVTGK